MSRRIERLNEQLKRELAEILRHEVKDPRVGLVTVTAVEASADLDLARVYIRPVGDDEEETLEGLEAAAPYIRGVLGRRLRIRRVPELRFQVDESLEHAMKIERLLREVRPEDGGDDEPEDETA